MKPFILGGDRKRKPGHVRLATKLPIILAHGICPFTRLLQPLAGRDNTRSDRFHYFRKIRSTLMSRGYTVFHARVAWAAGVDRRARDLRNEILRFTDGFNRWPRVHIIAHSMGGLDARHMLLTYRLERQVASLTTIGTPHRGTSYADWGVRHLGFLIPLSRRVLGLRTEGFLDLTRPRCRRFNERAAAYEAANGVRYRTVAGAQPGKRIFLPMRFSHRIILREEGENDGLVPVASAVWRQEVHLRTIQADHLNEIGWRNLGEKRAGLSRRAFEAAMARFYLELAEGLD